MKQVNLRQFDYEKTGRYDADMWRAYYNHQFLKLFLLLFKIIKSQLGLNWFITIRLAYYSAWAAADYRIHRASVNRERVLRSITKYYKLISKYATEPFDYKRVAELELEWWDVHRRSYKNNKELEQSLANAVAAMYHVEPASLKDYAHYRAEAMILPRHKGDSKDNPIDWPKIQEMTIASWKALYLAIQK
jgi:hypothetical protein